MGSGENRNGLALMRRNQSKGSELIGEWSLMLWFGSSQGEPGLPWERGLIRSQLPAQLSPKKEQEFS